jgi:hypothetical protein
MEVTIKPTSIEIKMPSEEEKKELLPLLVAKLRRARSICRIETALGSGLTCKCAEIESMLRLLRTKINPDNWNEEDLKLIENFVGSVFGYSLRLTLDPSWLKSDTPWGAYADSQAITKSLSSPETRLSRREFSGE